MEIASIIFKNIGDFEFWPDFLKYNILYCTKLFKRARNDQIMNIDIWICSQNLPKKDTDSTGFCIVKVFDWETTGQSWLNCYVPF